MPIDAAGHAGRRSGTCPISASSGARMLFDVSYLGNRTNGIWLGYEENPSVYIPGNCVAGQYGLTAAWSVLEQLGREHTRAPHADARESGRRTVLRIGRPDDRRHRSLSRRPIHSRETVEQGWSMSANYTRSKCINQGEPGTDIVNSFPDPKDPSTNEGPCAADRPHIFNMSRW